MTDEGLASGPPWLIDDDILGRLSDLFSAQPRDQYLHGTGISVHKLPDIPTGKATAICDLRLLAGEPNAEPILKALRYIKAVVFEGADVELLTKAIARIEALRDGSRRDRDRGGEQDAIKGASFEVLMAGFPESWPPLAKGLGLDEEIPLEGRLEAVRALAPGNLVNLAVIQTTFKAFRDRNIDLELFRFVFLSMMAAHGQVGLPMAVTDEIVAVAEKCLVSIELRMATDAGRGPVFEADPRDGLCGAPAVVDPAPFGLEANPEAIEPRIRAIQEQIWRRTRLGPEPEALPDDFDTRFAMELEADEFYRGRDGQVERPRPLPYLVTGPVHVTREAVEQFRSRFARLDVPNIRWVQYDRNRVSNDRVRLAVERIDVLVRGAETIHG